MNNATLSITLVVGGAGLAAMGVLRLAGSTFGSMPKPLAGVVVAVGAGIVAFGAFLPQMTVNDESNGDVFALEPQPTGATPEPLLDADIGGRVRTGDDEPVEDQQVTLAMDDARLETRTRADGTFTFEDVSVVGPVLLTTRYDGATFTASPSRGLNEPVEIRVAATTDDDEKLRVRASSLALVGDRRGIQAVHAITIRNSGNEAFAGRLRLPLLPQANTFVPGLGLSRTQLDVDHEELVSLAPVLPGSTEITYTYAAPLPASGIDFAPRMSIDTDRFDLLLAGDLFARDVRPPARTDTALIGDRSYERLSWRRIDRGAHVEAHISESKDAPVVRIGLTVLAVLAAASLVLAPLVRRRRKIP
jgi:hypothetical protein